MLKKKAGPGVVFMGSSEFAADILEALISDHYNIISVYTQPDKKVGRQKMLGKTAVKTRAESSHIAVYEPVRFDEEVTRELKAQKPDLLIVAAYGKILPKAILEIPFRGAVNVHASLLPKFRGPSPIQNAILLGEKETGTTIMLMDEGIDTGAILNQKKIAIGPEEIFPEVSKKLAALSAGLLLETVPLWMEKKIAPRAQDDTRATLCQLIEKQDGQIIWTEEARSIHNRWRAFVQWPGVFTFWSRGQKNLRLKLNKIFFLNNEKSDRRTGEVFLLDNKIAVQALGGVIILEEVQLEGKNKLPIKEFIRGYPGFIGSVLK